MTRRQHTYTVCKKLMGNLKYRCLKRGSWIASLTYTIFKFIRLTCFVTCKVDKQAVIKEIHNEISSFCLDIVLIVLRASGRKTTSTEA